MSAFDKGFYGALIVLALLTGFAEYKISQIDHSSMVKRVVTEQMNKALLSSVIINK